MLRRLYGTVPAPAVLYHPWRSHYWPYQDIGYTHLYGATYKSLAYFSFMNTYRERYSMREVCVWHEAPSSASHVQHRHPGFAVTPAACVRRSVALCRRTSVR